MKATITRFEYFLLKRMALVGIDWEIGNAIGVPDNPEAVEHVRLMKEAERKIKAIKPKYRK
jgi:hypothetical protein